jgi:hypothetical protein
MRPTPPTSTARRIDSVEEIEPRRTLIVGSCLTEALPTTAVAVWPNVKSDFIPYNNFGQLPAEPQFPISEHDLQILQIPLRSVDYGFTLGDDGQYHFSLCRQHTAELKKVATNGVTAALRNLLHRARVGQSG